MSAAGATTLPKARQQKATRLQGLGSATHQVAGKRGASTSPNVVASPRRIRMLRSCTQQLPTTHQPRSAANASFHGPEFGKGNSKPGGTGNTRSISSEYDNAVAPSSATHFAVGAVEGFNPKARVSTRSAYGFRSHDHAEVALNHRRGKLPEPDWRAHKSAYRGGNGNCLAPQ